jgi:hypothetical protein
VILLSGEMWRHIAASDLVKAAHEAHEFLGQQRCKDPAAGELCDLHWANGGMTGNDLSNLADVIKAKTGTYLLPSQIQEMLKEEPEAPLSIISRVLVLILSVPLALLSAGALTLWVANGFAPAAPRNGVSSPR